MKLATPVNTSVYVPTCLPAPDTDYTGSDVWVLGWGRTQEGGAVSDTLQELEMAVVEDEVCYEAMSGDTFPGEQLCAGGERGKDGCQVLRDIRPRFLSFSVNGICKVTPLPFLACVEDY